MKNNLKTIIWYPNNLNQHFFQFLVKAVNWAFPNFDYVWLGEETRKNLPVELDFVNEGKNCEKLGQMLSKFDFLKVWKRDRLRRVKKI